MPTFVEAVASDSSVDRNTILGNVKNAVHGNYHAIQARYLPRHLPDFSYRFIRRLDLAAMAGCLGRAAAVTATMSRRLAKLAETRW